VEEKVAAGEEGNRYFVYPLEQHNTPHGTWTPLFSARDQEIISILQMSQQVKVDVFKTTIVAGSSDSL
jgi:hypothetical protein